MKTNYFGHDQIYKTRRAKGAAGWADARTLSANLDVLEEELQRSFAPRSCTVLELGCGAGEQSFWLAKKGFRVHGIDMSPTAIRWAGEKAKDANPAPHFAVGDVRDLSCYRDEQFDWVLDGFCLHCILGIDRNLVLRSVHRVMKTGALLMIRSMCGDPFAPHLSITPSLAAQYDRRTRCIAKNDIATRYIGDPEQIVGEIQQAGLAVIATRVRLGNGEPNDLDDLVVWARKPV